MFLTADELRELTDRKRWSAQITWLREHHWAFTISADGRPKVARKEAERQLVTGGESSRKAGTNEPDFAATRRAG